jgi:hypothetical protein
MIFRPVAVAYDHADTAILMSVGDYSNHPMVKYPEKRMRMAHTIVNGSLKAGVPWEFVTAIIRHESAFRPNVISSDGCESFGLMQIHGSAVTYCRRLEGRRIDVKSPKDQVICGAHWLRHSIDKCQAGLAGGLTHYATGYTCDVYYSRKLFRIVDKRMRLYWRIKEVSDEKDSNSL